MFETIRAEVAANQWVVIDKMFGPLVGCSVRVHLHYDEHNVTDWVIERQRIQRAPNGIDDESVWEEVTRFDCQESIEFRDYL